MRKLKLEELGRLSETEYVSADKNNFLIVLDNVRSMHNVGSAFRTADAFRASGIYLCGITATPPNREITKTALGAEETVVWKYYKDTLELIKELKKEGWSILCVEQADSSTLLNNFRPGSKKYAIVFGNEVFGVQQEVIDYADGCLEIPQFGTKHSLNVSVSIGIVCWHFINSYQEKA